MHTLMTSAYLLLLAHLLLLGLNLLESEKLLALILIKLNEWTNEKKNDKRVSTWGATNSQETSEFPFKDLKSVIVSANMHAN